MPPRFPASAIAPVLSTESSVRPDARESLREEIALAFDQFREPLLRYLWTFGLEIQDSEEVLQDVFLSLFRDLDRGKRIDNVRGWLFRVAHNLALRRRQRTRREMPTADDNCTVDPAPNPEDRMASRQARERVNAVVEALPEQDRRCLVLRAEGLRYREISEILEMSLGAVSLSITRSLARIARSSKL